MERQTCFVLFFIFSIIILGLGSFTEARATIIQKSFNTLNPENSKYSYTRLIVKQNENDEIDCRIHQDTEDITTDEPKTSLCSQENLQNVI